MKKMSDLISRSALIKEIEGMYLYVSGVRSGKGLLSKTMEAYKKNILDVIKEQPTAYDVDAVVKELEESTVCGMFGAMFGKSDTEIIDIIRKGGVKRDFLLGSYNR